MTIQERRLERGWSQEELARHCGLSTRTIQRIEAGNKAGLESLKCLAAVFETSISELMQEQTMTDDKTTEEPMINAIERDAIAFAQSILQGPQKRDADPLTKTERDAINFAKKLLGRFNA
ncbi:MAG: helix-turn-helix transcriptional regulator [Pseudomonadota bacterium]